MSKQIYLIVVLVTAAVLLAVSAIPTMAAVPSDLPPRPTMTPLPVPGSSSTGATIALNAEFAADWSTSGRHWQDLWTAVEWQDEYGQWRDVAGWQGTLDQVADGVGDKSWWLDGSLFGKGPFRWVVYNEYGYRLTISDRFYLPSAPWQVLVVPVQISSY